MVCFLPASRGVERVVARCGAVNSTRVIGRGVMYDEQGGCVLCRVFSAH